MIPRPGAESRIREVLRASPVAGLLGPRQCGKTTLARALAEEEASTYFDLENPVDAARLQNPLRTLEPLSGLVVIDEFQRRPELFELLRVLVDRPGLRAKFLVLGSASPALVKGLSESLAGRLGFVDLSGFHVGEVGGGNAITLWVRGGFPRSFLAPDGATSLAWRDDFVRTFLERDIPQLGISIPSETLRRFWTMIAHFHGQVWNGSQFAQSLGTSENTARRYLDILAGAYVVRILPPWFENIKKRQVKAPKIYVRDSGILHSLMHLRSLEDLQGHPKLGASWEGFALEQLLVLLETRDAYYWATHGGAELDLFVLWRGRRYGFEIKYADAPRATRSMHTAIEDLQLDHLWVIYPGRDAYSPDEGITVWPLQELVALVAQMGAKETPGGRTKKP